MEYKNSIAFARSMDEQDPLKSFRDKFFIPQHNGNDTIYFTGNSLGLQSRSTSSYIQRELDDWAAHGVEGHFNAHNPWLSYHELFPEKLSRIVGCLESEVVAMNQLTVNLHLLMVSFYRPTKQRYRIICEAKAFPSDQYAFESQINFHARHIKEGFRAEDALIEVGPRKGEVVIRHEDILAAIEEHQNSVALVLFGGVNYYTGQLFDMKSIAAAAHRVGAYAGFDLAHAAGNVELHLHEWDVDFACWCSYKYLNSGPGAVAGAYIHERHIADRSLPRFAGWWGHDKASRFQMESGFNPIPTVEGWQLSNAPVLSMAAHLASLDIFTEAGMDRLHAKRYLLSGFLYFLLDELCEQKQDKIRVITPKDPSARGCQVSIVIPERGREVFKNLTTAGVISDWREPDVIRVAPVPLYNSFEEVFRFVDLLREYL